MLHSLAPSARGGVLATVILLVLIELLWHRFHGSRGYDWRETAASTAIAAGQVMTRSLTTLLIAPVLVWVYHHRLFDITLRSWRPLLGLFLGTEFLYYWFHRASHRVRWLWATHRVHHSSTRLNFSAAYRLGWTRVLSCGWLFFIPLVWLGYAPVAVFGALGANLLFQFFLHTEMIGRLGPLEWIFNTPSQHRVHHAVDAGLLDHNFGGVLILFDRLFGTHADEPRGRRLNYGLAGTPPDNNPFRIALGEWVSLLRDLGNARSPRQFWHAAFGRP